MSSHFRAAHEITQFLSLSAELAGNDTFMGEAGGNPAAAAAVVTDASLSSDCATAGCDICLGIICFLAGGGPIAEKSTEKCPGFCSRFPVLGFCLGGKFKAVAVASGVPPLLFLAITSRLSLGTYETRTPPRDLRLGAL